MIKKDIRIDRCGSDHIPFTIGQHWTKIAFDTDRIDEHISSPVLNIFPKIAVPIREFAIFTYDAAGNVPSF